MRLIELVEPDPAWSETFAAERRFIVERMGSGVLAVEHIGSTAIAGLRAKPIVDLQIEASSISAVAACYAQEPAYRCLGEYGIAGHEFVLKGTLEQRIVHIHIYTHGHPDLRWNRWFVATLNARPDMAAEYEQVKVAAVAQCDHAIERYMALKAGFIHRLQKQFQDGAPSAK